MLEHVKLSDLTTLRLGGPAPELTRAATPQQVADAVGRRDVLVLGGGSNLVVADAGVDVPVVQIAIGGISREHAPQGSELVTIGAGLNWDDVVAELTAEGFAELAPLSGIPGSVGATPVQNVGAYGVEVAQVLRRVRLLDRLTGEIRWAAPEEMEFGYRTSVLKHSDRAVVLDVEFAVNPDGVSAPLRYGELARGFDAAEGETRPAAAVRAAVLRLRAGKGMVLDASDHDTWSAGSFFTNPVVGPDRAPEVLAAIRADVGDITVPTYPAVDGVKFSAGWLIEHAGFAKGYPGPESAVRLSTKHTLALTNRGSATAAELVELARTVRDGVARRFGIRLEPEPVTVGLNL